MKCYRRWWLFSLLKKRRRQQQKISIIILGLCIISLLGFYLLNYVLTSDDIKTINSKSSSIAINCHCSKSSLLIFDHGECFFDQLVCYPGFIGKQCEIQIKNEVLKKANN